MVFDKSKTFVNFYRVFKRQKKSSKAANPSLWQRRRFVGWGLVFCFCFFHRRTHTKRFQEVLGVEMTEVGDFVVLEDVIGEGALSEVRFGQDLNTGESVAVKVIEKDGISEEERKTVFNEAFLLQRLEHPSVVQLLETLEDEESYYLVLRYFPGGNLLDYIERYGKITEEKALWIFRQILEAVSYCHDHSIAHRDIKLENVVLDENQNACLVDFGLALDTSLSNGMVSRFGGTPGYSSPEIVNRKPHLGTKADVWALGVVLLGMLCGPEFLVAHESQLSQSLSKVQGLTDQTKDFLQKMLEEDPVRRWTTSCLLQHQSMQSRWIPIHLRAASP